MNDNITVSIESQDEDVPEPDYMIAVVRRVLRSMDCTGSEVNIQVVDAETIRSLNRKYRNQDKTTNVLSFETRLPGWVKSKFIGDIVLCPSVIRDEASRYRKSNRSRWAHMLVHGTLHLLGMSHDDKEHQTLMEQTELVIMAELGFDDPYLASI